MTLWQIKTIFIVRNNPSITQKISFGNPIIKKQDGVVNKTFVQMLEALEHNVELTYVKRGTKDG